MIVVIEETLAPLEEGPDIWLDPLLGEELGEARRVELSDIGGEYIVHEGVGEYVLTLDGGFKIRLVVILIEGIPFGNAYAL